MCVDLFVEMNGNVKWVYDVLSRNLMRIEDGDLLSHVSSLIKSADL